MECDNKDKKNDVCSNTSGECKCSPEYGDGESVYYKLMIKPFLFEAFTHLKEFTPEMHKDFQKVIEIYFTGEDEFKHIQDNNERFRKSLHNLYKKFVETDKYKEVMALVFLTSFVALITQKNSQDFMRLDIIKKKTEEEKSALN